MPFITHQMYPSAETVFHDRHVDGRDGHGSNDSTHAIAVDVLLTHSALMCSGRQYCPLRAQNRQGDSDRNDSLRAQTSASFSVRRRMSSASCSLSRPRAPALPDTTQMCLKC